MANDDTISQLVAELTSRQELQLKALTDLQIKLDALRVTTRAKELSERFHHDAEVLRETFHNLAATAQRLSLQTKAADTAYHPESKFDSDELLARADAANDDGSDENAYAEHSAFPIVLILGGHNGLEELEHADALWYAPGHGGSDTAAAGGEEQPLPAAAAAAASGDSGDAGEDPDYSWWPCAAGLAAPRAAHAVLAPCGPDGLALVAGGRAAGLHSRSCELVPVAAAAAAAGTADSTGSEEPRAVVAAAAAAAPPAMLFKRSGLALARVGRRAAYAVGGYDGAAALRTVEVLAAGEVRSLCPRTYAFPPSVPPSLRRYGGPYF